MKPIKLGTKPNIPSPPTSVSQSDEGENKLSYPSLYIWNAKGMDDFPEEGTMTVRYKTVRETIQVSPEKSHSMDLEIHEIIDCKGVEKEKESTEKTLDKYREEVSEKDEEDD